MTPNSEDFWVEKARPELTWFVVTHMSDINRRENAACLWDASDQGIMALAQTWDFAYVAGRGGLPVTWVAANPIRPGAWAVWMFSTDDLPLIIRPFSKWMIRHFMRSIFQAGCNRVECKVIGSNPAGQKWLELIGGQKESESPWFGKGGETYVTYVWHHGLPKVERWKLKEWANE
jgi:hypothetical protein